VGGKQITSINVDRGGEFGRRVGDRMDNVFTERQRVFHAQRAGAGGFKLPLSSLGDATPEDVVLAPAITG
jgi:hypothetical protein